MGVFRTNRLLNTKTYCRQFLFFAVGGRSALYKICVTCGRFPKVVENKLMNYRKKNKRCTSNLNIQSLLTNGATITKYLERRFMRMSHMKPLEVIISGVLKR